MKSIIVSFCIASVAMLSSCQSTKCTKGDCCPKDKAACCGSAKCEKKTECKDGKCDATAKKKAS